MINYYIIFNLEKKEKPNVMQKDWRNQLQSPFKLFVFVVNLVCLSQINIIHRFNHQTLPLPNSSFSFFVFHWLLFRIWFEGFFDPLFLFSSTSCILFSFCRWFVGFCLVHPNAEHAKSTASIYLEQCNVHNYVHVYRKRRQKKQHIFICAPSTWYQH